MKTKIYFLFVTFLFASIFLSAKEIPLNEARQVALNFLYEQTGVSQTSIIFTQEYTEKTLETYYYVFNVDKNGYVIVAAEDMMYPIIGYSFDQNFGTKNQPANLKFFMTQYTDQIDYVRENNEYISGSEKWSHYNVSYKNFIPAEITTKADVYLPTALWNQDQGYNALCPEDAGGSGGHVYAGCVATAMSIVMKYYNYPMTGNGTHSYYAVGYGTQSINPGTTNYLFEYMPENAANYYVAQLMYHAGVTVNMSYGADGSGAYSEDVPEALRNHFRYNCPDGNYISRSSYSATNWLNLMKAELNAGRPIYYSGRDTASGHAFVVDGYREADSYLHFNFGWSGSGNGYFVHSDAGGFPNWQAAVIGIYPAESYYPYNASVENFDAEIDTLNLEGFNIELNWTAPTVKDKALTGYDIYRNSTRIVQNTTSTSYYDQNPPIENYIYGVRAIYSEGTSLATTDYVNGSYEVVIKTLKSTGANLTGTAVNFNNQTINTTFSGAIFYDVLFGYDYNYTCTKSGYNSIEGIIDVLYKNMTINIIMTLVGMEEQSHAVIVAYPNPSYGLVYLQGLSNENFVKVCDMTGKVVYEQNNVQDKSQLDLTFLNSGVYIISINTFGTEINETIIIK